jgi:ArsR family transcriptional regulator, arsenate/arsenite/antimonite-responsive transcriptional repressor
MDSNDIQELASLTKALGHPMRVQIVRLLKDRGACVCGDIVEQLPLGNTTVWQHLKVLKDAGIVKGEIDGPKLCYCLNEQTLTRLIELIQELSAPNTDSTSCCSR